MLKNADMPAMPMPPSADGGQWTAQDLGGGYAEQCRPAFGLTKREMLAMAAMQGMLSHSGCSAHPETIADRVIGYADALLAELEKKDDRK